MCFCKSFRVTEIREKKSPSAPFPCAFSPQRNERKKIHTSGDISYSESRRYLRAFLHPELSFKLKGLGANLSGRDAGTRSLRCHEKGRSRWSDGECDGNSGGKKGGEEVLTIDKRATDSTIHFLGWLLGRIDTRALSICGKLKYLLGSLDPATNERSWKKVFLFSFPVCIIDWDRVWGGPFFSLPPPLPPSLPFPRLIVELQPLHGEIPSTPLAGWCARPPSHDWKSFNPAEYFPGLG